MSHQFRYKPEQEGPAPAQKTWAFCTQHSYFQQQASPHTNSHQTLGKWNLKAPLLSPPPDQQSHHWCPSSAACRQLQEHCCSLSATLISCFKAKERDISYWASGPLKHSTQIGAWPFKGGYCTFKSALVQTQIRWICGYYKHWKFRIWVHQGCINKKKLYLFSLVWDDP